MLEVSVTKGGDEVAEKDIAEKTLEGYNDVFADIANVLLFNGRRLIKQDDLEDRTPNSSYKVDGKIHGQERDVAKAWRNGTIRLACIGTENQTRVDKNNHGDRNGGHLIGWGLNWCPGGLISICSYKTRRLEKVTVHG